SNADGTNLQDVGLAPVWGTSSSPILLGDVADGQTGPPTGWQAKIFNNYTGGALGATSIAVCGKAPSLQAFVYSGPVPQDAFGVPASFSVFAPIPDGWTAVGAGFDGGPYGHYSALDVWMQDGIVADILEWYPDSKDYDSGAANVQAFMVRGLGN